MPLFTKHSNKKLQAAKQVAIECRHLNYNAGKSEILSGVNFSVPAGSSIAVVGPNGGGKSTLLALLLGILTPKSGQVLLFGKNPLLTNNIAAALFQHHKIKSDFPITVREVIKLGLYGSGKTKKEKDDCVTQALIESGLQNIAEKRLDAISGGQRQRTYLARTWISESAIYFFDEPISFLDEEAETFFYEKIITLKKQGKTTLIISHDLSTLPVFADGLLCVNKHVHMLSKKQLLEEETKNKTISQLYNSHLTINPHTHK